MNIDCEKSTIVQIYHFHRTNQDTDGPEFKMLSLTFNREHIALIQHPALRKRTGLHSKNERRDGPNPLQ